MQVSFNWLKQHVKLPDSVTALEVAEKLKMSTVEVEGIVQPGALLDKVVVGKVISAEKHPNADKLKVCQVDVGTETVTIVCGGSNVVAGMFTVVAKNGAKVKWHGEGELVELKPTVIRGVESHGMICSADEVGLLAQFPKKEEKEIVDLGSLKVKPGTPIAEALGLNDAIFEIDNKSLSNRPDLWGHYGLAREVAVLFNREVKPYKTKKIKAGQGYKVKVSIDDQKLCSRYLAVAVSGVTIKPSPVWLQTRLTAAGLRPINNVVDITNFIMLDIGEPMHAFDVRELGSSSDVSIIVKKSAGEKFTTLDGNERTVPGGAALIATLEKTVAIAGIMGGAKSAIAPDTTTVVFEAANFDAASIRCTSTSLGLRTDSSTRFEKSLDPTLCAIALERAVELLKESCPGVKVVSAVAEAGTPHLFKGPIEMPVDFISSRLGIDISLALIKKILERLGFTVKEKGKLLSVTIPSWRATRDVRLAEDLVEEVVRIYGYDKVPGSAPVFPTLPPAQNVLRLLDHSISQCLASDFGYTEVYSYSFVSAAAIAKVGELMKDYLELDNPLSKEKPFLRRHLLLNLLETAEQHSHEHSTIKLFEIGKIFHQEVPGLRSTPNGAELLPRQDTGCTALFTGSGTTDPWNEVRAIAERLGAVLGGDWKFSVPSIVLPFAHPARCAEFSVGGELVGHIFELHPKIAAQFKLEHKVGLVTLNVSRLAELLPARQASAFTALALYPAIKRDVAFVVKNEVTYQAVSDALRKVNPLLTTVELFDVYAGSKLKAGEKSMAFHLTYQHRERTLTTAEIDTVQAAVEASLQKQFGAEIRK